MNQVTTIDTNNFAAMAQAMGMEADAPKQSSKASTLARLRIHHTPIMGQQEVNGKMKNVEVIGGGAYKLEIPDGPTVYAEEVSIRPFLQRFMYKKFIKGNDNTANRFVKTVMGSDLNNDMKDNDGGFNCGKPAGFIKDWAALPDTMKDLIKSIKRVRALFGTVEMVNPTDENGEAVDVDTTPFIWEIDNRDAFKTMGEMFTKLTKMRRLPPQHYITSSTKEVPLPNGSSFYIPVADIDLGNTLDMDNESQENFASFIAWIENYNTYILNTWSENMHKNEEVDVDTVEAFVDIDVEDFA
jgi:hypothetical protein|tara:strand:- start:4 stop:897 length:894 start_codon:yes stop_codon:yes gene_type:complete